MHCAALATAILVCACGRVGFSAQGDAPVGDGAPSDESVLPDLLVDEMPGLDMLVEPSLCIGAGVRMCDGFESPVLDARWELDNAMGTVTIDTTRSYRGASSLRSHVNAIGATPVSSPRGSMRSYQGLPVTGTVFVRVFAYFPSTIPSRFAQFINSSNDSGLGASTGMQNRDVVNNDYSIAPSNFVRSPTTQMPLDRWVCVTYQIASGAAGSLRVYVDGTEITDVAITPTGTHPAPNHIYLGLDFPETFSNQAAADAWFDEIIVDDSAISCAD